MNAGLLEKAEELYQRHVLERAARIAAKRLEERMTHCADLLKANPEQVYAWHSEDAPLLPESGNPVSVVLVTRQPDGQLIGGELLIPRERFDPAALQEFLEGKSRTYKSTGLDAQEPL